MTKKAMLQTDTLPVIEKAPLERYVAPEQPSLIGLSRAELAAALGALGVPQAQQKMRVQQLWHWLYHRGATSFDAMSSVSKELRALLAQQHTLDRPAVVAEQVSVDGTRKWLLRLPGEVKGERPHEIETVYIPDGERGTLCVSSQVGCTLNCSFCHTGTQRLVRNLTAGEIVGQVMVARDRLGDWPGALPPPLWGRVGEGGGPQGTASPSSATPTPDPSPPSGRLRPSPTGYGAGEKSQRCITNIVLMGMGEPLYNFEAVRDAIHLMADGDGIAISKRRITLSTSGVVPLIERAGAEIGCMLAVSLHATNDALRNELVPLNRKYPIAQLLDACRNYPGASNAKRITFEYVMLKGIPAKINLIPFNPWPGTRYECSDWERIEKFSQVVFDAGYASPVRTPRGRDILAACGQLKSASEKLSARERLALRAMAMVDE